MTLDPARLRTLGQTFGRRAGRLDKPARMALSVVLAVAGTAAGSLVLASSASAAVPAFPDNIVVFPNRDFISVDGFDEHIGETATVTVTRPGVGVVGASQAQIAGGSPSFEINHPGGSCWGNFSGAPQVTPDILPGDIVKVSVGDTDLGDTRALSGMVADIPAGSAVQVSGSTLTIRGTLGGDVNPAQVEQRIIAPELRDTVIARRDVRALPGPVVLDARGQYSSGMTITGNTFVATYVFPDASIAAIAAAGGPRFMAWEVEDGDANRQGLTIAEYGEPGGPGMGGCPNGPLQSGPVGPTNTVATQQANGSIRLTWTPAVAVPGTPPITGYRVRVREDVVPVPVVETEVGRRINDPNANGVTITGLDVNKNYLVEVASVSSVGETYPPLTPTLVRGDTTPPSLSLSPNGPSFPVATDVAVRSSEANTDLYYAVWNHLTSDPKPVLHNGGVLTADAVPYTGPVRIDATKTLLAVGFDQAGNVSDVLEQTITITGASVTSAPTGVAAAAVVGGATVTWSAPASVPVDAPVTKYTVRAYAGTAVTGLPVRTVNVAGGVLTADVNGLDPVQHVFTVTASNAAGDSPASDPSAPITPTADVVAVAANVTAPRPAPGEAAKQVTLTGAGSTAGATYTWSQVTSGGANTTPVTIANPGALTTTFQLPATTATATAAQTMAPFVFRLSVKVGTLERTATATVTVATNTVTVATARFRTSELRITGSTPSAPGATTVRIYYRNNAGTLVFIGNATLVAGATPGAASTYDFRLKPAPAGMATGNPVFAFTTSSGAGNTAGGAQAGPFTPSN